MHGDAWTGEKVLAGLIKALGGEMDGGLAAWSPKRDEFEPIAIDKRQIEARDLLAVAAYVLGRDSPDRIRLLTYASRCARSGSRIDLVAYCGAADWSKASFWRACARCADHLNARDRELTGGV